MKADSRAVTFTVTRVATVSKTEFPAEDVFLGDGTPALVLVTCGGAFDQGARSYEDNVIVWLKPDIGDGDE